MPYITKFQRPDLDSCSRLPVTPGELNYVITRYLTGYCTTQGLSYQTINDVLGALEGAKQEFYRRVAVPYEDAKKAENGDVF